METITSKQFHYVFALCSGDIFDTRPELRDLIFAPSGMTGAQMREVGKARVNEWLDYRSRFGFSEFNSDTYGPIAMNPVLALAALSPDLDIRERARMVANLQMIDMVLGSNEDRLEQ